MPAAEQLQLWPQMQTCSGSCLVQYGSGMTSQSLSLKGMHL